MPGRVVCIASYRSEPNESCVRRLAERPPESPFRRYGGGPRRVLNDRQLAHRQQMLEHLQRAEY